MNQLIEAIDELESAMMRLDCPQECFDKLEHVRGTALRLDIPNNTDDFMSMDDVYDE